MSKLCKDCGVKPRITTHKKPVVRCTECQRKYTREGMARRRAAKRAHDAASNDLRCNRCKYQRHASEFGTSLPNGEGKRNKICDRCLTHIYTRDSRVTFGLDTNFWRKRAYSVNSAYRSLMSRRTGSDVKLAELPWICKPQHLADMCASQNSKCGYCRVDLSEDNLAVDHIEPKSLGGEHHINNLILTCSDCNHLKHTRGGDEFIEFLRTYVARFQALEGQDKEPDR